jgi:hypothetical protein
LPVREYPKRGEVYTVTGFADTVAGLPGSHLREVADLKCACHGISNVPWLISAFRPLDERKTDIGALTSILDRQPEKVPA